MKALWCGATALAFVTAVSFSPVMAQGPKPSSGSSWHGISLHVARDKLAAHSANPSFRGPRPQGTSQKGFLDLPFDAAAAKIKPHYEWQYHYAGRHARWEGHWVRVMAPIQTAPSTVANGTAATAPQ
jgi:hypothetical protein